MQRFPRTVARLTPGLAAAALLACDGEAPTAPDRASVLPTPVEAAAIPSTFVQVTQGAVHTCGITADDRAFCWGDNPFGELGDGTTTRRLVPRAVAGGLRFKAITAGTHFTCGLTTEDRAYCWGYNVYYQLGDGTTGTMQLTPSPVAGNRRFRQIRAGARHTCAVTFADVAFCWGENFYGQLGAVTEGFLQSNVPLRVETGGPVFRRILPGGSHTCALTATGVAYCWGDGRFGQLGNGTLTTTRTPTRVSGSRTYAQLTAGSFHTCGVSAGKAYCWGDNGSGGLGDGTQTSRSVPTAVAGGLSFKGLSASFAYTCGITTADRAYCWGRNDQGQLGDGTFGPRKAVLTPTKVLGGYSFTAIGGMILSGHTCAVTPDRRAYCWGDNSRGQLGNGTTARSTRPVPVN